MIEDNRDACPIGVGILLWHVRVEGTPLSTLVEELNVMSIIGRSMRSSANWDEPFELDAATTTFFEETRHGYRTTSTLERQTSKSEGPVHCHYYIAADASDIRGFRSSSYTTSYGPKWGSTESINWMETKTATEASRHVVANHQQSGRASRLWGFVSPRAIRQRTIFSPRINRTFAATFWNSISSTKGYKSGCSTFRQAT